ncbi:MAG: sarcosine oxidase subunit gamma [Rhodobacteraceae bacterium]|nr:sarcosine oxidase subunit gamma [Paracoccaceae bacterium]
MNALQKQLVPVRGGKPGPAGVTLSLLTGFRLTQIAAWPETLAAAAAGCQTAPAQGGCTCAVPDISSARTLMQVSGPQAPVLLNPFLPQDLRPSAFPAGCATSTAFHHVGVTLWRTNAGFTLALPSSFAASLRELLEGSALQYGLKTRETPFIPAEGELE